MFTQSWWMMGTVAPAKCSAGVWVLLYVFQASFSKVSLHRCLGRRWEFWVSIFCVFLEKRRSVFSAEKAITFVKKIETKGFVLFRVCLAQWRCSQITRRDIKYHLCEKYISYMCRPTLIAIQYKLKCYISHGVQYSMALSAFRKDVCAISK